MNNIIQLFERYLKDTLAFSAKAEPWKGVSELPFFMRELYDFGQIKLMNVPFLFMIAKDKQEPTPATIEKHQIQLAKKWGKEVIYLRPAISSYNRKRLIEHKIPFVVPGTQTYLPMLGIDLREHFKALREERPTFSPGTQAAILYVLYNHTQTAFAPSEIAKHLGYTPMTMTRAFEEIKSAGIGEHEARGKERFLHFADKGKKLWEKVLPYLKSPVKKRVYARALNVNKPTIGAGLMALAHYSTLAEPKTPVYAITLNDWKLRKDQGRVSALPMNDAGAMEIELWSYRPEMFAQKGVADRLSVFLSFKGNEDERVEAALETMMEGMAW